MRIMLGIVVVVLFGGAVMALAQTDHAGHREGLDHAAHDEVGSTGSTVLTEPGQGAFAALSEVVRVLEADPETDWSRVDLNGLRAHLVDMDRLITKAAVREEVLHDGILAKATGDQETIATLRRMVPAHARQLSQDDRWTVSAYEADEGVELRVTSEDPNVVARIRGLGFFGLMASQDHHREHHLMMSRGEDAHSQ